MPKSAGTFFPDCIHTGTMNNSRELSAIQYFGMIHECCSYGESYPSESDCLTTVYSIYAQK